MLDNGAKRNGLPLQLGSRTTVHRWFQRWTRETPTRVIGDNTFDGDKLDQDLAKRGVELIAPHRNNRRPENVTQVRRLLQRAARRWTVERTISWTRNHLRLCSARRSRAICSADS